MSLIVIFPIAYAEEFKIIIPPRASSQAVCEEQFCFVPHEVMIMPHSKVVWINNDYAAHTVTSGVPSGPDKKFDASLFVRGSLFSFTFDEIGTYPYFCANHPWMVGKIVVGTQEKDDNSQPKVLIEKDEKNIDEVRKENELLKSKISSLEERIIVLEEQILSLDEKIGNLNAIILEQVKVIYKWVLTK